MRSTLARAASRRTMMGVLTVTLYVLLGAMTACGSPTATIQKTPSTQPGTPGVGTPTQAPSLGPFNASFAAVYASDTCAAQTAKGTTCLSASGTGSGTNAGHDLGKMTLRRMAEYAEGDANTCTPATTQGTLTTEAGDTITFTGSGTFCLAFQTTTFTYTVTGGTGGYQHASGTGTINVPPPSSPTQGTETWSGTLVAGA